jgi:hypothetical protein
MAIGYATALLCNAGAKEIYLSGFDGYNSNSELQTKMNNYLMILQKNFNKMKFFSLTPTTYSLKIKKI